MLLSCDRRVLSHPTDQRQWQVLREQKERGQALRSSACRADSGGITSGGGGGGSGSSGGSQSVHRHAKVLVTRLQERNAHCLDEEAADSRDGGGGRFSSHRRSQNMQAMQLQTMRSLHTDEGGRGRTGEELSFLLRVTGDGGIHQ